MSAPHQLSTPLRLHLDHSRPRRHRKLLPAPVYTHTSRMHVLLLFPSPVSITRPPPHQHTLFAPMFL
ncbi:hypothetical protein DAEQUDRAFT_732679 [Daedalea quercina L-15889]|uniref:Uncharacterized protein n=1 Tax=Daedalea quercina L-15889 TaxID=1314783 RepID=A0A165LHT8_9APHY|nr:hypothetical protein DAEQUDRAFT_732679 [Daedalea quercina L-15889]